jgi:hypothetical protein
MLGHELTAELAEPFLTRRTRAEIRRLLPTSNLKSVAAWADQIKSRPSYAWSYQLHYISGSVLPDSDQAPHTCSVSLERDCPDGNCVVTAILNYTQRLIAKEEPVEALRFLVHFIGDIHQPLHNCKRLRGGNDCRVKFNNQTKFRNYDGSMVPINLHTVWDELMLDHLIVQKHGNSSSAFRDYLIDKMGNRLLTSILFY